MLALFLPSSPKEALAKVAQFGVLFAVGLVVLQDSLLLVAL